MSTYIALLNFTNQGAQSFRESPLRANAFKAAAQKSGIKVRETYWTMGDHDGAIIFDAANDEVATAAMLSLGALGNVRTKTLRAFDPGAFKRIIARSPKI
ncbi:MAG TPA: GYD domain-containing protein [Verrucomicrobiae bacterium]|jgi:uncharacterized protein with GYD domain